MMYTLKKIYSRFYTQFYIHPKCMRMIVTVKVCKNAYESRRRCLILQIARSAFYRPVFALSLHPQRDRERERESSIGLESLIEDYTEDLTKQSLRALQLYGMCAFDNHFLCSFFSSTEKLTDVPLTQAEKSWGNFVRFCVGSFPFYISLTRFDCYSYRTIPRTAALVYSRAKLPAIELLRRVRRLR